MYLRDQSRFTVFSAADRIRIRQERPHTSFHPRTSTTFGGTRPDPMLLSVGCLDSLSPLGDGQLSTGSVRWRDLAQLKPALAREIRERI